MSPVLRLGSAVNRSAGSSSSQRLSRVLTSAVVTSTRRYWPHLMKASATSSALRTPLHAFFRSNTGQSRPSLSATTWAVAGSSMSARMPA